MKRTSERSPLNPHECAEWANDRMIPELVADGYRWFVDRGQLRLARSNNSMISAV